SQERGGGRRLDRGRASDTRAARRRGAAGRGAAVNLVLAMVIGLIFGVSFGWCWGYHARPQLRRVWACARCDEHALTADEQARFKAITRYFDQPGPKDHT